MTTPDPHAETFTPAERAYIRSELDRYFTTLPPVAEGLMLRTWRTGPRAGQPKLGPAAQSWAAICFSVTVAELEVLPEARAPIVFFAATAMSSSLSTAGYASASSRFKAVDVPVPRPK
jgi:hypothetical protein